MRLGGIMYRVICTQNTKFRLPVLERLGAETEFKISCT
jgi:hypothetical protein